MSFLRKLTQRTSSITLDPKELKQPDAFQSVGKSVLSTLEGKGVHLLVLFGILLLAFGGIRFYQMKSMQTEKVAMESFSSAKMAFQKDQSESHTIALKSVAQKYPHTRAALEAYFILGDHYFDQSKFEEANTQYQAATEAAKNPFDQSLAYYSLSLSQEAGAKNEQALENIKKAISAKGVEEFMGEFYLVQARLQLQLGQIEEAKKSYQEVTTKYPASEFALLAQAKLSELQ